jgi:hypothetical protein
MSDPIAVIQATLAPSFLISGTSIFLNFTQTRLFRVVDRLRAAGAAMDANRKTLERRARVLRNAVAVGVFTVALTVVTAILLMGGVLFGRARLESSAPYVFAIAMLALLTALCFVLYDTILSVRSVTGPAKT